MGPQVCSACQTGSAMHKASPIFSDISETSLTPSAPGQGHLLAEAISPFPCSWPGTEQPRAVLRCSGAVRPAPMAAFLALPGPCLWLSESSLRAGTDMTWREDAPTAPQPCSSCKNEVQGV